MARAWIEARRDRFVVVTREEGKKRYLTGSVDREEAELVATRHNMKQGMAGLSLAELIDLWAAEQNHSEHSKQVQRSLARVLKDRKWTKPLQVTKRAFTDWNVERGGKGLTEFGPGVSMPWQYLRTILRWANREHHVPVDQDLLAAESPRKKRKPPRELLTQEQVESISTAAWSYGKRAGAVIDYLLTYGARPITACRLTRADINPDRLTLTIPDAKHSGGWTHPVRDADATTWLSLLKDGKPEDPLFPHYKQDRPWVIKRGGASEMVDWYRNTIVKQLKESLPDKHGIYDLKRYAISRQLDAGLDPATVASFTGHRILAQVLTYDTTNRERQDAALHIITGNND